MGQHQHPPLYLMWLYLVFIDHPGEVFSLKLVYFTLQDVPHPKKPEKGSYGVMYSICSYNSLLENGKYIFGFKRSK